MVLDLQAGRFDLYLDGVLKTTFQQTFSDTFRTTKEIWIGMSAYGWWTGHYAIMDDFMVSQPGCSGEGEGEGEGILNVAISPPGAVSAGAMWSLDAASTMYASGETVTLAAGSHVVKFADVAGWTKPADIPVTIIAGQETNVTGAYVRPAFTWGDLATASGATPSVACNGKPGGQDAALVLKYYAGILGSLEGCPDGTVYASPAFPPGSDVNGDGQLGGQDAAYILKYYAGLISCFPADTNCDGNGPETP